MIEKPTISSVELNGDQLAKRWAIFRESKECAFLHAFLTKRIEAIRSALEKVGPLDNVKELQGSVGQLKSIRQFLLQTNIQGEVNDVREFLKSYGY